MSGAAAGCLGHSFSMWNVECGMAMRTNSHCAFRIPRSEFRISARLPPMIALARKYRPKKFADLIVQEHIAAALRGAVAGGRVAHGYLFAGPRGVGKTTAARILAMALNCERRGAAGGLAGEPCGECDSCTRVWTGAANLDVVELDAASNRGVDDARDLRERAMYAASAEGRHKVYIVDEAHMLTREAWNALLKVLEEPPPRVVFVFATTEPQKIAQSAAPILSRLRRGPGRVRRRGGRDVARRAARGPGRGGRGADRGVAGVGASARLASPAARCRAPAHGTVGVGAAAAHERQRAPGRGAPVVAVGDDGSDGGAPDSHRGAWHRRRSGGRVVGRSGRRRRAAAARLRSA